MKNLILFSAVVGLIVFSISGCSKGSAGPQGPAGPAGSDSILHSAWMTLAMTQNVDANNDTFYTQTVTASALTSTVLSNDVVVSYIGVPNSGPNGTSGSDTLVVNVSDVYTLTGGGYITQDLLPGIIELLSNFDLSGNLYRYVVIPSSQLTSSVFRQYTAAQLKAMDYSTITKLINQSNNKSAGN